jgi:hypothetical protein
MMGVLGKLRLSVVLFNRNVIRLNMSGATSEFSDYIVFVDESGSPTLSPIDPNHPVFVLVFCVFKKSTYCDVIQPAIKRLKFEFFGHDMTILHSHEIRKRTGDFNILMEEERRQIFLSRLDEIIQQSSFDIIATVIDKREVYGEDQHKPDYIYHHALWECVKKLFHFLNTRNATDKLTHIIAESRGKTEDANLIKSFEEIPYALDLIDKNSKNYPLRFHTEHMALLFAGKKINSAGLQIADLIGHPIGRHAIKPEQPNHAFEIIKNKIVDDIRPFFMP